ncbi:MAG: nickel pincer cofactor biosynthesis protein LarB, partial [Thermoguttaceae bacterium]|nr:nickel pincer cofactor biosynthesis protein LarB [Thermoguttaceae bacterium]
VDLDRERRCGFSEVIYGEGKTADAIRRIGLAQMERGVDVFATRVSAEKAAEILPEFQALRPSAYYNEIARTFRVPKIAEERPEGEYRGKVAVLTAGTSDLPVAEEARETVLWSGADVVLIQDVGVAGPRRLVAKLPLFLDADAIVVVAGMEGALPSVVGGYVSAPIIAVPTSVGYGAAFGGVAAALGMLNSCASNVAVVNIDAGFKAGYVAGLIAKRVADAVNRARAGFSQK